MNRFRKPYLAIFLSITILLPTITSCSNDEYISEKDFKLTQKALDFEQLLDIANDVNNIQKRSSLSKNSNDLTEQEMEIALQPLVENGRLLHNEIVNNVDLSNPEFGLTSEDINQINNLDDRELAQLSFTFSVLQQSSSNAVASEWDTDTVMNCLGAALGLHEIYGLIQNTAQLATAQGTVRVLKLLARRYIGWIGVAVAVYSFGNCMEAW